MARFVSKNLGAMMVARTYVVKATWDDEARVWVAVSDDVPGLVAEAEDVPQLVNKLTVLIPELLEANGVIPAAEAHASIPVELVTQARLTFDARA